MIGAPTATPRAYMVMSCPADEMLTPKSSATLGSRPMMTNSVIPIANEPSVSESKEIENDFLFACSLIESFDISMK